MASFFKKALGVFVEFDDEQNQNISSSNQLPNLTSEVSRNPENHAEAEKFEKYFDNLFDKANLPGPDYYEFYKTMEMLEAHIKDETARVSATFASLAIQGLTKKTLIETANKYKQIIEEDQLNFEQVLTSKMKAEVGDRQQQLKNLEQKIASNSELIQKLTKEITDAQIAMGQIKNEVLEQENKLTKNKNGYQVASQAVLNKIASDIQKIQSLL
jgi:hypothetical protein